MSRQICLRDLSNQRDLSSMPPLTKIKLVEPEAPQDTEPSRPHSSGPPLLSVRHVVPANESKNIQEHEGTCSSKRPHSATISSNNSNSPKSDTSHSSSPYADEICQDSRRISGHSLSERLMEISPALSSPDQRSPGLETKGAQRDSTPERDRDKASPVVGGSERGEVDNKDSDLKQLNKLKRFLATVQQFAFDISVEIGEKVRDLVLALVNSQISIEDFHSKLHQTTNFPLRPFVVPFLKATLPLLQEELLDLSPTSSLHLDGRTNRGRAGGWLPGPSLGVCTSSLGTYPKCSTRISATSIVNPGRAVKHSLPYDDEDRLYEMRAKRSAHHDRVTSPRLQGLGMPSLYSRTADVKSSLTHTLSPDKNFISEEYTYQMEEEWSYVDELLRRISGMVERCKEKIASWEYRRKWLVKDINTRCSQPLLSEDSERSRHRLSTTSSSTHRNPSNDLADTARKMDEIVKEVRVQALSELHKAVAAAELSAAQAVAVERLKMERTIEEIKVKARQEAISALGRQRDSVETCLNCGREANETCSGCRVARYCGKFCQLRHWEIHHKMCGKSTNGSLSSSSSSIVSSAGENSQNYFMDRSDKRKLHSSRHSIESSAKEIREISSKVLNENDVTRRKSLSPRVIKVERMGDDFSSK